MTSRQRSVPTFRIVYDDPRRKRRLDEARCPDLFNDLNRVMRLTTYFGDGNTSPKVGYAINRPDSCLNLTVLLAVIRSRMVSRNVFFLFLIHTYVYL